MRKGGGVLEVSLGTVDMDVDDESLFPDLSPGPYVKMTVADTGHGMESSVKEQIFDPYFTTKGKGEGTGLGLAVVHGIIKSHGGIITVESEPGKGTTFDILLPMIEGVEKREAKAIEPLLGGKERILFIDDEELMVEAVEQLLEQLGYKVTSKTSSIEALEAFRETPHGFDLIITDYTMPNMTGADLAKEFVNIRPDISIILCTGFSEMINKEKAEKMGIKAYVMKPVVTRELARIIRDVLDENETLG
jgi:CheY-like chemotaxis protein